MITAVDSDEVEVKKRPPKIETILAEDTIQQQGVHCNGPTTDHTNTCITLLEDWLIIDSKYKIKLHIR